MRTDKYDLGYVDHIYNDLFTSLKPSAGFTMFEIGIYNGDSILLWDGYLGSGCTIYAGDVNKFPIPNTTNVVVPVIGNCYDHTTAASFRDGCLDLLVDDGPHTYESFVLLLVLYQSKLKVGGTMVIEDIIQPHWACWLADLAKRLGYSSSQCLDMRGRQLTPELLSRWEGGLDVLILTR